MYMNFRLVAISVTLNDLERRNGPYFALFHRLHLRCRRQTIVRLTLVSKSTLTVYDHIVILFDGRRCIDYH